MDEVEAVLRGRNPRALAAEIKSMAKIVSIAVDVMSGFPALSLRGVAREHKLRAALEQVALQFVPAEAVQHEAVERTRGSGLGEMLSLAEGRARRPPIYRPQGDRELGGPGRLR